MFADPSTAPNSLARQSPEQQQGGVVKHQQQQQDLLLSPPSNAASPSSSTRTNRQLYDDQQQQQQHRQKSSSPKNESMNNNNSNPANIQELQTNLIMQDRIIATLESDNSRLLTENKNLRTELKQAKEKANIAVALNHPNAQQQQSSSAIPPTPTNISPETAITIASLKEDLAKQREEIDQERKDMARKISWYIDRQEVSAAQDALVSEQQAQIRDLRLQVADLEAQVMTLGGGRTASSSASSPTAEKDKQIRVLNRRVAELEETIRNHSPDSLAELIRATRPPLTEAAEFKKMKAQLEEANARLEEQEQSAQRALSQLRVDSDNLRSQYAKRLEKVEEEMKLRIAATQTRKTKELEKSLSDTRRFYSQKVKDLEEQLAGYKRGDHHNNQNRTSSSSHSAVVNSPHFTLPTHQQTGTLSNSNNNNKQQQHSSNRAASASSNNNKKTNNQENKNNNNGDENNNNNNNSMMIMTPFGPMPMNQQNMNNLLGVNPQQQQQQQMMSMMMNNNQGNSQHQQMPLMIPVTDPSMQQKIWFLETRVKTLEEENRFLQKQASESVLSTGAAAAVQSQLGESQRENVTLQRLLRESQDQQRKTLHELEERLHHEKDIHAKEVERLNSHHREEMKALQTRCDAEIRLRSDSVTSRQLMAFSSGLSNVMGTDLGANASTKELRRYLLLLAERVHSLERQLAATESEHTRQLNELKRVSEFELEVEKQKMGIALKQKNAEIDGFKVQLDSMLDQISRLRK